MGRHCSVLCMQAQHSHRPDGSIDTNLSRQIKPRTFLQSVLHHLQWGLIKGQYIRGSQRGSGLDCLPGTIADFGPPTDQTVGGSHCRRGSHRPDSARIPLLWTRFFTVLVVPAQYKTLSIREPEVQKSADSPFPSGEAGLSRQNVSF